MTTAGRAQPARTAPSAGASSPAETWLQYTHLDKLYGYLPGLSDALPGLFGLAPGDYDTITQRFAGQARRAARTLLSEPDVATAAARLPFRPGQTVLAVGDSVTDDLRSWAEILRHILELQPATPPVTLINGGLSAHTTAMVLRRWPAALAVDPDWVLCQLGTNDVTRVGPEPTKPQVSLSESIANLHELRRIAAARNPEIRWVWLTPPPVLEERALDHPGFRYGQSRWRNSDIAALSAAVGQFADPVVDVGSTYTADSLHALQGPDGVHPSLAGQAAIARALLLRLGAEGASSGRP
jgi:acyl-CoA thioesterase-1